MISINPKEISVSKMHSYLLGAVTPRPIAFASTIDKNGNVNLSPFSFFNCFGANPPILIFSPARRVRDNTTKHTYENALEVPEVVVSVVNYNLVQQASLASTEYGKGVNEFLKAGLTAVPSTLVKPPRVGESPISMECQVLQVIPTGHNGGAGNLIICEIVMMHIKESVLDEEGKIDPIKLDVVARLGGDWYCRVGGQSIFKVPKPLEKLGIGIDNIPDKIKYSKVLTGNDLGILGNVQQLPDSSFINDIKKLDDVRNAFIEGETAVHKLAQECLKRGDVAKAWAVLLS